MSFYFTVVGVCPTAVEDSGSEYGLSREVESPANDAVKAGSQSGPSGLVSAGVTESAWSRKHLINNLQLWGFGQSGIPIRCLIFEYFLEATPADLGLLYSLSLGVSNSSFGCGRLGNEQGDDADCGVAVNANRPSPDLFSSCSGLCVP